MFLYCINFFYKFLRLLGEKGFFVRIYYDVINLNQKGFYFEKNFATYENWSDWNVYNYWAYSL